MLFLNKTSLPRILIIITFQLICASYVLGQKSIIKVIDSKTKESISYAHVCIEELGTNKKIYLVTDKDGLVQSQLTSQFVIAISFVGYKNYTDTLQPKQNYEISLVPQAFDLDQVVVTASFTPQKVDKSIYNIKVIDSRKMELKAASSLTDVLKDEVNFQVSYDPALGSGIKIKGLSGNNVKILIDGVPVIGRMGGNIDLNQLNLYNVDHVEIVEGPMSVIYGSNALAGAINIITKENLHSNYNYTFNTYLENLGTYNFDGIVALKKGKSNFSFSGGRKFFSGVYLDQDHNRSQTWKPKEQYNGDFYYTFSNKNYKLKYQFSLMNERLLDKGDQLAPTYRYATDSWFRSNRFTNRLEYNLKLKNEYFLNIVGSHAIYQRRKLSYFKDFINSTSELVNDLTSNDTTTSNAFTYNILFGKQNPEKHFNFISGVDLNYEIASGKRILNERQTIGDYALFTILKLNVGEKLIFQPGFRFAYNTKFSAPPVPSINVKWEVFPFLNIRSSYVRAFRAPSIKELFISFKDVNHDIQPNESLKPEQGNSFDLSFSFNSNKVNKIHFTNIDLNLFYTQSKNLIFLAPISSGTSNTFYKYVNISYFSTLGGQLSFKYSFYPRFDYGFGIGHTGIYASSSTKNKGIQYYKFSPSANMNASYLIPKADVKVFLSYKYSGINWNPVLNETNGLEYGSINPFHTIDVSFIKKLFSNKLTLSIGFKNLLDNKVILSKNSTGETPHTGGDGSPVGYGRLFFTSLSFNFFK